MESISISLDLKNFQALLNGLVWINYEVGNGGEEVTYEYLIQRLYAPLNVDINEAKNEIYLVETILKKAASENWSEENLSEFLTSKQFSENLSQVYINFWRRESQKIHQKLIKDTTFNNTYNQLTWRVDIKAISKTKSTDDNEPIAFLNMKFETKDHQDQISKFEMNRQEIEAILTKLNDAQASYEALVTSI